MNFEFDLESAVNVLDTASDLSPMDALAFTSSYAERSRTYFCLIDNARDKIRTLITQMNEAINAYLIIQNNSLSESNAAYNETMEKYKHLDEDTQRFILDMVERLGKTEG